MKRSLTALAVLTLSFLTYQLIVDAQETGVTGVWTTQTFGSAVLNLKADGTRVTGTVGQNGSTGPSIANGQIVGDIVTFSIQVQGRTITFTGIVKDDEIAFNRDFQVLPGVDPGGPGIY